MNLLFLWDHSAMAELIDRQLVQHIAHLSRLKLSEQSVETFQRDLSRILEYMDQLNAVDTAGVEPSAHPLTLQNVLRDDQPRFGLSPAQALGNAPQQQRGFFAVPKVLERGDSD